jgi:hypothetical protein
VGVNKSDLSLDFDLDTFTVALLDESIFCRDYRFMGVETISLSF